MAGGAGVPGGAVLDCPAFVASPVALRGHVQAERLGRALAGSAGLARRRRVAVVVSVGGRAVRVGQGGIQALWARLGAGIGAGSGSGEGGGGGGRRSSARSPRQSAVTQRDAAEALT